MLLCIPAVASAAQGLSMTAALELSQIYRPGAWQPVRIEFRNETGRTIESTAVLPLTDAQAPAVMKVPVTVPPHCRVRTTLWGYFPERDLTAAQRKEGRSPPLGVAEWRGPDGAVLARSEIVGATLATGATGAASDNSEMVLLVQGSTEAHEHAEAFDAQSMLSDLAESAGVPLSFASVGVENLSREPYGLRPVKLVVMDEVSGDSLDVAQRQALLNYLRGGGVLLLSAPSASTIPPGDWLETLLPVRLLGNRLSSQVQIGSDQALKLREMLPLTEAASAGGQVLLWDRDFVHVAEMPVGLGKVIFTSFPINALESSPASQALWSGLLALDSPRWQWSTSALGELRTPLLATMIGRRVAPWGVAAGVVGGYLLVVVLVQGLFFGARRPRAFVASLGVALALSAVLVLVGMARRSDQSLQSARLAVLDIAPGGGGWKQETIAFVGADDAMSLQSEAEAVVRPARSDVSDPPAIRQQPFAIDNSGVQPARIDRVWESAAPLDPALRLNVSARFAAGGLTLDVDNQIGQALKSPLVIWNGRAMAIDDLPDGKASVSVFRLNARGDFAAAGVLASEQDKRRAQVISAALAPPADSLVRPAWANEPMLVAWLDQPAAGELLRPSNERPVDAKSMVMVRTPLRIEALPAGTHLRVPAALARLDTGHMPYDMQSGETAAVQQDGQWLVSFAVPRAVGQAHPTRATLSMRVSLPGHELTVRKSQCPQGAPRQNPVGETVATWQRTVGRQEVSFDIGPGDIDSEGRLWLLFDVHSVGAVAGAAPLAWQIQDLGADLEAEVIAPPVSREAEVVAAAHKRDQESN